MQTNKAVVLEGAEEQTKAAVNIPLATVASPLSPLDRFAEACRKAVAVSDALDRELEAARPKLKQNGSPVGTVDIDNEQVVVTIRFKGSSLPELLELRDWISSLIGPTPAPPSDTDLNGGPRA